MSMTHLPRLPGGTGRAGSENPRTAWIALWAMMVGFFMIMLDSTIVVIANPTIMADLRVGYSDVVWVTSAYLLGYAVVLLVAGRLGDRFGPKNLYLVGLAVFTAASLWCGLSGSVAMLITARVVQGVGAGVLTPQTLSTITRIFGVQRRGVAMSVWGATAGVASLVGPLAGGALVDGLGWEWIFFVNVPIGIVGLGLAFCLLPALPTQRRGFDLIGVGLSGAGMFLLVFALQQGQSAHWQPWIWAMIVAGVGFIATFLYWQSVNTGEPLIPLRLFADRDFSLCSAGVAVIAFATTALVLPLTFYAQLVCGLPPTRAALLIAPLAIASGGLAPVAGMIADRYHPTPVLGFGFSVLAIGLTWLSLEMAPDTPIWRLVLPVLAAGAGMAFVWSPLTATATRNVPTPLAGASSGVYNAIRQLGAVLGSAGMAGFMTWQIGARMPLMPAGPDRQVPVGEGAALRLPEFLREPFSTAMAQSMLLPAFIALFGIVAAVLLVGLRPRDARSRAGGDPRCHGSQVGVVDADEGDDDDDYVEVILRREHEIEHDLGEAECDTEPLRIPLMPLRPRTGHQPPAPLPAARHSDPVKSWHGVLADPAPRSAPIGLARNGSRIGGERFRPTAEFSPRRHGDTPPDVLGESEAPENKHHRAYPHDTAGNIRHSPFA
jgi:EmrB/QacA subfamily drug resistance transporter